METGGVILCTDGSLSRQIEVNQGALWQNLTALQKMRSLLGSKMTVAVVPRRIEARAEVLPRLYDTEGLTAPWDSLRSALPDAITFPSLTSDAHWYRTDHHWTTEGAYLAYCQLGAHLGYTPFTREEFSQHAATDSFLGTTDAAASLPFTRADTITLWRYENDTEYTVKKDGKAVPFAGLYDFDKLQTRDGYGVFLGGNCGVLEITGATPRQRLLILRDSFSNAILPFLARHYEIIAVDPRYTRSDLQAMAQDCHAVLCLFGMQTLCTAAILK